MDPASVSPADPASGAAAPPRKRSAWKRFRRRAGRALVRALGPFFVRLLAKTWRVRFANAAARDRRDARGKLPVYGFWHQNILAAVGTHFGFPVRVLISLHRDGETVARLAEDLGYKTVRGSTYGGGAEALREMARAAEESDDGFAFTPDGPRGPARSLAPGVVVLAANTGRALTASGFAFSSFWQAKSWDRMVLPKPFARVVVGFEGLAPPPPDCARPGAAHDAARASFARAMDAAEERARRALAEWTGRPAPEVAKS